MVSSMSSCLAFLQLDNCLGWHVKLPARVPENFSDGLFRSSLHAYMCSIIDFMVRSTAVVSVFQCIMVQCLL